MDASIVVVALLAVLALDPGPAVRRASIPPAMVLTQADVPDGLRPNTGQTGPQTRAGNHRLPGRPSRPNRARRSAGQWRIVNVLSLVTLPPDPSPAWTSSCRARDRASPGTAPTCRRRPRRRRARLHGQPGVGPLQRRVALTAFRRGRWSPASWSCPRAPGAERRCAAPRPDRRSAGAASPGGAIGRGGEMGAAECEGSGPADLILTNANVITMDPDAPGGRRPWPSAQGRILAVGTDDDARAGRAQARRRATSRAARCCPASTTRTTTCCAPATT